MYFDTVARKNTGIGNVIRAAVTLDGNIPEEVIRKSIEENEWVRLISSLSLKKNLFSVLYRFENEPKSKHSICTFHDVEFQKATTVATSRDCNLLNGNGIHLDVAYDENKTHLIFSVSHILMDHAGMENLLLSFTGENNPVAFADSSDKKSLSNKFSDAFTSTLFVASLTGWSLKRLARKCRKGNNSFELVEFTMEETRQVNSKMINQMHAGALPFFLGCSLYSISRHAELITGKNYFVPVPVDRRTAANQNSLISNFISFLYFSAKDSDMESLEKITEEISKQTISQARKNIPDKFSSLLDLFRYVPNPFYKSFIGLPSNGHAATFAFSLLTDSKLKGKEMFGKNILNVTHYPPVISPPGMNVIFNEFNGRLKILCSFDERRITKQDVISFLGTLKSNLLE